VTDWASVPVGEVGVGDHVRVYGAVELDVTRIDTPFLGRAEMVLLVESTDERWACAPVPTSMEVEVAR
jgi:hypothetical protein